MKFYKCKNAVIGEGVEATRILHKDIGDELICITEGADAFEKQNSKAKECSKEDADTMLSKNSLKIRVPSKKEIRKKTKKMKEEEIIEEINNKDTATIDIEKTEEEDSEGNKIQKLTYYEDVEIKSIDDFLAAQEAKKAKIEEVEFEEEEEVPAETPVEEEVPVEEEKPQ